MLSLLLASGQLGLYAAGLSMSAAVRVFGSSFALVALPALARPAGNRDGRADDMGGLMRATVWSSMVADLGLLLLVPGVFRVLFGPAFSAGVAVAQVLVMATVALNASRVLSAALKAANLPTQAGIGEAAGAVATVLGMLALIPPLGLMGAALASVLSYLVSLAYLGRTVQRRLGVPLRALFVPSRRDLTWLRGVVLGLIVRPALASA